MRALVLSSIAIAAASGACDSYARIARTNAPGIVDLATPPPRENGSDELYVAPSSSDEPTSNAYVVWLHPAFGGGLARRGAGGELGVAISVEKDRGGKGGLPLSYTAWGVTAGAGLFQFRKSDSGETVTDTAPLSLEAYYRRFVVSFGAGAVVYPDTRDTGAQVTIRGPLTHVRLRYVEHSGFEVMLAYDLSFPFVFGWSR